MEHAGYPPAPASDFSASTTRILASVESVIGGKPHAARAAVLCLLAEGHLLIEDVPGVGKTVLARALAASVGTEAHRVQFTPDLLPGDITGVSIFNPVSREFEFKRGAIFANIVIADEINRSSPKTQSALLEAMEEGQVTVDGATHLLPEPFFVLATQNPLEMEGTFALPEAQRDRFMMRISMGYPDADAETRMLHDRDRRNPLDDVVPAVDAHDIVALIHAVRRIHVAPALERHAVSLARATRSHPEIRLGASPRATLQLMRAAKANAALEGRDFVIPDDISSLVEGVFAHRVIPARSAFGLRHSADPVPEILAEIIQATPVPLSTAGV